EGWLEQAETDPRAVDVLAAELRRLRASEGSARALTELLGDRRLAWLRDTDGRNLRALAVAALVRMGYPHALGVSPEDLALMRSEERAAEAPVLRWMNALLALAPGAVAAMVLGGLLLLQLGSVAASLLLIALCSSATAAAVLMGTFGAHRRDGFRAAAG